MKTEGSGGEKNADYYKDLQRERKDLDANAFPNAARLLDEEVSRSGKKPREHKPVDVYNDKATRASVKVMVPVNEHPKFNFIGKLLGPGGSILKKLQEETQTKMSILGRGSMRDKKKEEEFRTSGDPKYSHLNEDLHVEIVAFAPPSEAYARLSFALAEIRKYLTPDDEVPPPMYPMGMMEPGPNGMPQGRPRGGMRGEPPMRGGLLAPPSLLPRGGPPGPRAAASAQGLLPRPMSAKTKVMSILDRARAAMEGPYGMEEEIPEGRGGFEEMPYESYAEDSYGKYDEYGGGPGVEFGSGRDYYEVNDGNFRGKSAGGWKPFASPAGGPSDRSRFRHAPYSRSAK